MKILVIDNNTKHLAELKRSLAGHQLTIQKYRPGVKFKDSGQDLVILSGGGGEGKEAIDRTAGGKLWYQDEIEFIKQTNLPMVGICMGFELIAQAYGAKVKRLKKGINGWRQISLPATNPWKLRKIWQFEAHDFCVKELPKGEFDIIGKSDTGVELIRHKRRPLVASQFHPEVHGSTLDLDSLMAAHHLLKIDPVRN